MIIYNVMEGIVKREVNRLIESGHYTGCQCERCKSDIMARTLNLLPAKYVVTKEGELISQVEATMPQNQADILAAVVTASKLVQASPRH